MIPLQKILPYINTFYSGNGYFKRLFFLSIITLIITIVFNSCKDSYGVDSNVIKNQLSGDTIKFDTTYINLKKVIIREIVRNNITVLDTEYIDTNVPISVGTIKNLSINIIYVTNSYPQKREVNINNKIFLNDYKPKITIDYNPYLPKINFVFGCSVIQDSVNFPFGVDSLRKIDISFTDLDYFYLVSDTSYDILPFLAHGARSDIWLSSNDSVDTKYSGLNNGFFLQARNPIMTGEKISNLTFHFNANIYSFSTGCQTQINGTLEVIFN